MLFFDCLYLPSFLVFPIASFAFISPSFFVHLFLVIFLSPFDANCLLQFCCMLLIDLILPISIEVSYSILSFTRTISLSLQN